MQRFARIDIADPGDDSLVEECDFDRPPRPRTGAGEYRAVERSRERFRSQHAQRSGPSGVSRRNQIHDAEPARVVEHHS
jgi:hypothetical protein